MTLCIITIVAIKVYYGGVWGVVTRSHMSFSFTWSGSRGRSRKISYRERGSRVRARVSSPSTYSGRRSLRCQMLLYLQFLSQHLFACIHEGVYIQPVLVLILGYPLLYHIRYMQSCSGSVTLCMGRTRSWGGWPTRGQWVLVWKRLAGLNPCQRLLLNARKDGQLPVQRLGIQRRWHSWSNDDPGASHHGRTVIVGRSH